MSMIDEDRTRRRIAAAFLFIALGAMPACEGRGEVEGGGNIEREDDGGKGEDGAEGDVDVDVDAGDKGDD